MDSEVLIAVLSLAGTLVGTFTGLITGTKVVDYRIKQLEKKVEAHNSFVERVYKLEGQVLELQHDFRDLKR